MGWIYEESKEALINANGDSRAALIFLADEKDLNIASLSNENDTDQWYRAVKEFGN